MGQVDFLVVGAGIAGLRAAAGLARAGRVLIVTKEALGESNTAYAQGGIAVAMEGAEDVALHLEDTIAAGDGLVDREAAAILVEQGPHRVEELLAWGTDFDREHGELMRTREGAHSRSRILHAHGDATGREIAGSLLRHVRALPNVELAEWTTTVDLILEAGRVAGAILLHPDGTLRSVYARAVLLASGGAGQVFSETTNPAVATGDGIAMAYRVGAELMDMEFMQFHPTAFALPGAPRFLMSEALRGEGAWLVNAEGERFMQRYDSRLELAPRDIVARAIAREALHGEVYLDMRSVGANKDLKARFPTISAFLAKYGLELARDLIRVRPAAHYLMGGIRTDIKGRTSLRGLYAAGECACTGVHGANRLASNSLLEGLVFGALAAEAMMEVPVHAPHNSTSQEIEPAPTPSAGSDIGPWICALRCLMWRYSGLLRDRDGLDAAQQELAVLRRTMPQGLTRIAIEARNLHLIAEVIVRSALAREESRGAHFRSDFPGHAPQALHSVIRAGNLNFIEQ
ncbi:MAG TPA: L-aspartate oxidase [Acidobacteriaceae bacterium]|nr:L-aspartate oxidase [Acidobacteriaceae bacterium]